MNSSVSKCRTALTFTSLLACALLPIASDAESTYLCAHPGIQQLRIYEVNRANREHFHERFEQHALRIMKRHEFDIVDMWESDTGDKLQFVYVLRWPDEAAMDSRWKAFMADPEWIAIKKTTAGKYGELVKEVKGQPLRRVTYGPACD